MCSSLQVGQSLQYHPIYLSYHSNYDLASSTFNPRPFTFGDIPAISAYLDWMDAYLSAAVHKKDHPLNLVLVKPDVPSRQFAHAIPTLANWR